MIKIPPYLKTGDKVAIVATARKISEEELAPCIQKLQEWGLEVVKGLHVHAIHFQFAGTTEQRISDLQWALDDTTIKAVFCARGGYGTVKLIDHIDFTTFKKHPKWIVGYSDITVLHSHLHQQMGVASIHATMPINYPKDGSNNEALHTLKKALFGDDLEISIPSENLLNRSGYIKAPLIGGNLSILYSLMGSNSQIDTAGKILFLEDLDEYLYHVDRMMMNMKRGRMLENLAGLLIGGMTDMNDNATAYGKTAYEIIANAVKEYNYPVAFDFPVGHWEDNRALICGMVHELNVDESTIYLRKVQK